MDPTLDWVAGGLALVTAVMAAAKVWLGWQTRAAVKVSEKEAEATVALGSEARRDRELAIQPVLILGRQGPSIEIKNIGRGPALRARIFLWRKDVLYWSQGYGFAVAAGAIELVTLGGNSSRLGTPDMSNISGEYSPDEDFWAYRLDQLGNALRFNLRTGGPPLVSLPADAQRLPWVAAIEDFG